MKLSKIHHIAIIGTDYNKTTDFYINKLKFEVQELTENHLEMDV